jgi:hypothetical protein
MQCGTRMPLLKCASSHNRRKHQINQSNVQVFIRILNIQNSIGPLCHIEFIKRHQVSIANGSSSGQGAVLEIFSDGLCGATRWC